jgi:hypothetical protein
MPLEKLENFSKKHPALAPLVGQLLDYIKWQRDRGVRELVPRVVAAKLGISEADALGLLSLFDDAGLVKPRYDLVCGETSTAIKSFDSLYEIPEQIECNQCDREHGPDELRVELVFEIRQDRTANAAA